MASNRSNEQFTISWQLKTLMALQHLHGTPKGCMGSKIEDIVKYITKTYKICGDVKSEVICALERAVNRNFVYKMPTAKYRLLVPTVSIVCASQRQKRKEINRLDKIFPVSWCRKRRHKPETNRCNNRESSSTTTSSTDQNDEDNCTILKRQSRYSNCMCTSSSSSTQERSQSDLTDDSSSDDMPLFNCVKRPKRNRNVICNDSN